MEIQPLPGVIHLASPLRAAATADRLESLARERGLSVFARIDFARDAARVGLELASMIQVVFGDPRSGTAILAATPVAGLALPLRALAWEDRDGQSWLTYETPERTGTQYRIPDDLLTRIAGLRALCESTVAVTAAEAMELPGRATHRAGRMLPRVPLYVVAAILAALIAAAVVPWRNRRPSDSDTRRATAAMLSAMHDAPTGDPDQDFVQRMVPHHQGAIAMARAELLAGRNQRLRRIAQEIIVTQQQEIAALRLGLEE